MNTITIPKELTREGELVIIPRKEYEEFLRVSKRQAYTQLDQNLNKAIAEYRAGKYFGPFETVKPTIEERKAIERGQRAIKSGDYISLKDLKRESVF